MGEMVSFKDTKIHTESFGSKLNPAILLIMGAASSMIWWEEEFCMKLVDKGFFVIRYDNRDTGKSTTYEPFKPEYTFSDMADDAIRVLDAYFIEKAIIMGMSMGGMLTQLVALKYPERVKGIVLLASLYISKDLESLLNSSNNTEELFNKFKNFNSEDKDQLLELAFLQWSSTNMSSRPHDREHIREMIKLDIDRAKNYNSRNNHYFIKPTEEEIEKLFNIEKIKVPTLVVHGTEDGVIPYDQGKKLSESISGAVLHTMVGAGHEINSVDYDDVVDKICSVFRNTL